MTVRGRSFSLAVAVLLAVPGVTWGATAPNLGVAESFAVLGAQAVSNTGPTVITGDLGISPNTGSSVTGFPPGLVIGAPHFGDAVALQAQNDVTTAYNVLAGQACDATISADLGGTTLTPGVYCSASSMGLTGTLTLDAQGDPNAVFIFQIGSTLTTASSARVQIINGGQACNVFWQIGSSAVLGTDTVFVGNMLALTSISLTTRASVAGRVLARTGAVTLDTNVVSIAVCGGTTAAPTLGKTFSAATILPGAVSTLTITLGNPNAVDIELTAALVDTLPAGVVIAAVPNVSTTCGGAGAPVAVAGGSTVTLPSGRTIPATGTCTLTVDVTAAAGGVYANTLPPGALVTTTGSNAAPAVASLTVIPAGVGTPTVSKTFSPGTIPAGGIATLVITLSNPSAGVATLTADLVDTLLVGVVIAATPNASTTCGGVGGPVAVAGGSTVTLPAGATIPINSSCVVSVDVTAAVGGAYFNTLLAGALETSNGDNETPAVATLTVVPPLPAIIPTLSEWAMIALVALLIVVGVTRIRRLAL